MSSEDVIAAEPERRRYKCMKCSKVIEFGLCVVESRDASVAVIMCSGCYFSIFQYRTKTRHWRLLTPDYTGLCGQEYL